MRADHDSVDGFFKALLPHNPEWRGSRFIFRGHGRDEWKLLPTLERPTQGGHEFEKFEPLTGSVSPDAKGQLAKRAHLAETSILWAFAQTLVRHGMNVPGKPSFADHLIAKLWRRESAETVVRGEGLKEIKDWFGLMSMAQHYGLPTRLLDWTWSPMAAAQFACAHWLEHDGEISSSDRLCVWAVKAEAVAESEAELVVPASSENARQVAQSGLFTYVPPGTSAVERIGGTQLDTIIGDDQVWTRLTLPATEAHALWALLNSHGVRAAQLLPGPNGAAKHVRQWYFARNKLKSTRLT